MSKTTRTAFIFLAIVFLLNNIAYAKDDKDDDKNDEEEEEVIEITPQEHIEYWFALYRGTV